MSAGPRRCGQVSSSRHEHCSFLLNQAGDPPPELVTSSAGLPPHGDSLIATPLATLLAALLALSTASNAQTTTVREGDLTAVELTTGLIRVDDFALRTDGRTRIDDFGGGRITLAELVLGERVRVDYFSASGSPPLADRVRVLSGVPPVGPALVNLDVPFGTESQPLVRVFGDDAGDALGSYGVDGVAFGDLNGDGFDDLVGGAPTANGIAGEVTIVYGKPGLRGAVVDLDTDGELSPLGETRIVASGVDQVLGSALACGDFDADGLDDLFIGAPGAGFGGQVVVVYGSATLPGTRIDLALAGSATTILADELQESLGTSLASGDIDGDGFDDLLIGAPGATPFANHRGGKVYVVYGNRSARGTVLDLDTDEAIGPAGETRIFGERDGDGAGSCVASGDLNGDGFDDVVLGANRADTLFTTDRGGAYVVYGRADLRARRIDLGTTLDHVGPAGETRLFGRGPNTWLGTDLATGDVDGDGFDDLLVSAAGVTGVGDNFAVGELYVFYGRANLPGTLLDLRNPPGTYGETRITGTEEFGELGTSVGLADVNGDGFDDLVLGAPGSVPLGQPDNPVLQDGLVFLYFGTPTLRGRQFIDPRESANVAVLRDNAGDSFGQTLAAGGDLDRDGVSEYAASAPGGDNPSIGGENSTGSVVGLFGSASTPTLARKEHSRAGDAPPRDFGPVARCLVDAHAGTGSSETVTLLRSAPLLPHPPLAQLLPVHWQLASDRDVPVFDLTLSYTDLELGTASEGRLAVYTSATGAAGSWKRVAGGTRSALRNEITVRNVAPGFFALVQEPRMSAARSPKPALREVSAR
ncbi:MAG: hypothetical protein EXS08_16060 [Planctomycetes bacterium]|nr:hypothetical protein [Planctomycetota bacterium]